MRPLTDAETKSLFDKLANYTGRSLTALLTDTAPAPTTKSPDRYIFRIQASRVYYVRETLANLATSVARHHLLALGTCLGKFTRSGKFRLHVTALDVVAPHARYKVWVKPNGEMPFLYGGHVVKAHVGRWSEDCPEHQGVVVMSMNDTPLVSRRRSSSYSIEQGRGGWLIRKCQGFGVTARSTAEARRLDPTGIVTFRQADVGEYLRDEDTLFAS
ncbi:60S ribosome subunit biogenesis protein nip7 [Teratosphaeria destructans]|uniref:60S ribosome subunit biogenesis protein NIP7 n=1 Tax=Teratosphaeria destructans TaxID=418781 RepID=A0A9W7SSE8_9PEZI|nr:60S ribosome subunit biogenesis protein nip7 [Teratosphaeria destructans]